MTISRTPDTLDISHLHAALVEAAAARRSQLAALPAYDGDLVAEAHRTSIMRILKEIRSALDRVSAGTYGRCVTCRTQIPVGRLELRPWSALCVHCANR